MSAMETKWTWFERHFNFDFPATKMPDIVERLRGTPQRASDQVDGLTIEILKMRDGEAWSIQENVAHISDLEPLWSGRIDDILGGNETMRDADLSNRATFAANHHDKDISQILTRVKSERKRVVEVLESLNPGQWEMGNDLVASPIEKADADRRSLLLCGGSRRLSFGTSATPATTIWSVSGIISSPEYGRQLDRCNSIVFIDSPGWA